MRLLFILIILAVSVLFLTGDGWKAAILGTHALDINGKAKPVSYPTPSSPSPSDYWSHYGGDQGGARYSPLDVINTSNVTRLKLAWKFSTGDMKTKPPKALNRMAAEGTPLFVSLSETDAALIFCTPFNEVIAVSPDTGTLKWRYDAKTDLDQRPANQFVCRGVAARQRSDGAPIIYMGTNDGRLVAIDALTGSPYEGFGDNGIVTIEPGIELIWPGEFQITSPPVISENVVVIGSAISDNARVAAPSGAVRAFDAETGEALWSFDPIPRQADAENAGDWQGAQPPTEGHANAWAPMSVDDQRGLIFVPTSSPSPDFYGGLRPGDNRYANSVVALDAKTGAVRWAFQTVHHDVWDYDLPAQPGLYTITDAQGSRRDVVAQVTKTGFTFVLDRETGDPVLPVEERPVPQQKVEGELLSPTQPFPVKTPPIVPSTITKKDAWGITGIDKALCRSKISSADNAGLFTAPSTRGMLQRPFSGGGANWGGTAFDPTRNLLVVNMSNLVHHIQLIPQDGLAAAEETFHGAEIASQSGAPYGIKREVLMSPLGLPCTAPPWGVLAAVDLSNGEIVWRKTIGTTEDLTGGALSLKTGTPTFGGPIATAGDVVFIGAALDDYLRAFDIKTGKELWKGRLPGGAQATPMTYQWGGKQYVVIYAGGHARAGTTINDELVAFALDD